MIPLRSQFGDIDIYLFDQLLRGRITPGLRVVDAGCGAGRNLVYLLQSGFEVFAVDADARAVETVRDMAARLAPSSPNDSDHFRVEPLEAMTFPSGFADVAISSAVLHFARDDEHFDAMLNGTWRLVAPGGFMFCRLASSIGLVGGIRLTGPAKAGHPVLVEGPAKAGRHVLQEPELQEADSPSGVRLQPDFDASVGRGRYLLPDGSERYLVDEVTLVQKTAELGGVLLDPIKTTVVQNQRCMTTWVLRKA